jgi:hypothetical protein
MRKLASPKTDRWPGQNRQATWKFDHENKGRNGDFREISPQNIKGNIWKDGDFHGI